jgi:hypothetical protein
MKFGLLKSKIEKCMIESYKKDSFKKNMFLFKELVLENKNISKIFYLYNELSSNKNLSESNANEFINETTTLYENTVNKIKRSEFSELEMWVNHIKTDNKYEDIDNLFSNNVLTLESKIKSKKTIVETLKSPVVVIEGSLSVPVKTLVESANKTAKNFIETLDENSKKSLLKILSEDEDKLQIKYDVIKESVIEKLDELKLNEGDQEVIEKINETVSKIQKETFDRVTYFKLQELYKNL